jgi:hypothetical protein
MRTTASYSAFKQLARACSAILMVAAASTPTAVSAASARCGPRTELLNELSKQYREAPVAVGLVNSGALVEVLTSESGTTWTILVSRPDGTSCLVAAGKEWQALKRVAGRELGI